MPLPHKDGAHPLANRTTYVAPDGSTGWFATAAAVQIAEDQTRWDGQNHVSIATGSAWTRETLHRTAGGAWVIEVDNRDGRGGTEIGTTWRGITPTDAEDWLRRQGLHDLGDEWFSPRTEHAPTSMHVDDPDGQQ